MNAIPAKVAGVEELVMTSPTPDGVVNPLVLLAADLSGISTVFRLGGAHAIAALAYGTETIRPVDKITGPGNAYVAAAKRQGLRSRRDRHDRGPFGNCRDRGCGKRSRLGRA